MNKFRVITTALLMLNLTGCVGVFVAGAATTYNLVTDPRSSGELVKDNEISLNATALGNKPPLQSHVRLSANTFRGKVLLMGQAEDESYKQQAADMVKQLEGVNTVFNQIRVRPLPSAGEISTDVWITTKVKTALLADKQLNNVKIAVYTEGSEVFLVGAVPPEQGDIAVEIARNISGVKQVIKAFYQVQPEPEAEPDPHKPAPVQSVMTQSAPAPAKRAEVNASGTSHNSEVIPYREPVEDPLTEESL